MFAARQLHGWRPGVVCLLAGLLLSGLLVAACGGAERDDSGAIRGGGDLGVFALRVGDCFDDPPGVLSEFGAEFTEVDAVPCAEGHDNEVFAIADHPAGVDVSYPGTEALNDYGLVYCLGEFERYVGTPYEVSRLDLWVISPSESSWERDDRELVCALFDLNLQKLTGSMGGSRE